MSYSETINLMTPDDDPSRIKTWRCFYCFWYKI